MDYLEIQKEIRRQFAQAVRETFAVEVAELALGIPPSLDLGEVSIAACFELAKMLRLPPRKIAEELRARLLPFPGVGGGRLAARRAANFRLERDDLARDRSARRRGASAAPQPTGAVPPGLVS